MLKDRPLEDAPRLRRCIDDLSSLVASSSIATDDVSPIGQDLAGKLLSMLEAEVLYVRLADPNGGAAHETVTLAPSLRITQDALELGVALEQTFGPEPATWPAGGQLHIGEATVSIAVAQIGTGGNLGTVVAGARRTGFPAQTDRLLLGVSANRSGMALHGVHRAVAERNAVQHRADLQLSEARRATAERELQRTIDNIPARVGTYNADGSHELINSAVRQISGFATVDNWRDAIHPDDIGALEEKWTACVASGEPFEMEYRSRADGGFRWYVSRRMPARDESGQIVRWYAVNYDIEDRKRAEEALRSSERESRLALDSIPGFVAIMTPAGALEAVNNQLVEFCGRTLEELSNWGSDDTIHPEDLPYVIEQFTQHIAAGTPYDFEARIRRHDGVYRWLQVRGLPLRDANSSIARWYVLLTDIDERKHAEARLAATEQQLRLTLDSIPTMALRATQNGFVESVNKRWSDYTGCGPEDIPDGKWYSFVHPDDLTELLASAHRNIPAGRPIDAEARLRRHDGVYRWFLFRVEPARDLSGEIFAWYGTITDIEDKKRAEEALQRSEAELQEARNELQLTIDTIPTLITAYRPGGERIFVNRSWQEYSGISREEASGPTRWSMTHPDDVGRADEEWRISQETETPSKSEVRLRRADGEYRWHVIHRVFRRDAEGRIVTWYSAALDIEDRKRAEEARQQSEDRLAQAEQELRLMLDSIPAIAWRGGSDGHVRHINKRWYEYTGTTPEQSRGKGWRSCVHPDDIKPLMATAANYVPTGQPADAEARLRRHDGVYRWFLFRPSPARDETGKIVAWYGIITDIEDRKRAEQALQQSEVQLAGAEREARHTLDSIPTIAWRGGANGYVQALNQRWFEYTGTTAEQMRGARWKSCVHPDDIDRLVEIGVEYITAGVPIECEARLRRHDGEYRWFLFRPAPSRDEAGNIVGWYGSIIDIEDRKQAEERLRRSEASLVAGQRISQTGTFSWQLDIDALVFSDELYRIFEFDPASPVTFEKVAARFHPEDAPALSDRMKLVRSGRTPPDQDVRLRMPDGRIKHLRTVGQMIDRDDGKKEYLGAIQDVTERRLAEETRDKTRTELAHVTRIMSLGALTASIAHEVNQPLAGIITNASTCLRMLAADPPNVDGARETARRTIRDGNRAADVISRLRALFSRKGISKETVDLNTATREVLSLMFADLLRNRIILRAELDSDQPLLVAGDRVQLQQVILNLVRNAMDAMREVNDRPRQLLVSARMDEEGRACLIVKDVGVGFDPHGSERLFDAFYTTKGDGMGIGLSVSRSIIESHGGILRAVSNEEHGATFSFAIPRQDPSDADLGIADATYGAPNEGRA